MNRKLLIKIFTFLGGIYFFLRFFLPKEINGFEFGMYHEEISLAFRLIASMAVGLGIINIMLIHAPKVTFVKRGWFNSIALLIGLISMFAVTMSEWLVLQNKLKPVQALVVLSEFALKIEQKKETDKITLLISSINQLQSEIKIEQNVFQDEAGKNLIKNYQNVKQSLKNNLEESVDIDDLKTVSANVSSYSGVLREVISYQHRKSFISNMSNFLYEGLFVALGAAMFSLLAFYVASAAYRAFRIKTLESSLMMLAAVVVILGQIPFGLWLWSDFPALRLWLLEVPNSAAFRAIVLGSGVAGLIIALRMWLSIETEYGSND